jgi:hypothetical protein
MAVNDLAELIVAELALLLPEGGLLVESLEVGVTIYKKVSADS